MIANSYWKRVGMIALAYVVAASCPSERWTLYIDGANKEDDSLKQLQDGKAFGKDVLEIHNYRLDKLPHDLGKNAASNGIRWVAMESVSAPDDFPTEAEENIIAPFTSVIYLNLSTSFFGSPKSLSWIKLLFPTTFELRMSFEVLPVQTESDIAVCSERKLAMESVKSIIFYGGSGDQANLPIFENLRLFPNLELIQFESFGKFLALENAQGENISLEKVEKIVFDRVHPMSQDVMRKLPTVFPNVQKLLIHARIFEELTSGDSTGTSIRSFEKLTTLRINCDSDVHIGAKLAEAFPNLSRLVVSFPPDSNFTIHPPPSEANATQLGTLEEIRIRGGTKGLVFSSKSFKDLFPNCTIKHIVPPTFSKPSNPRLLLQSSQE